MLSLASEEQLGEFANAILISVPGSLTCLDIGMSGWTEHGTAKGCVPRADYSDPEEVSNQILMGSQGKISHEA